MSIQAVINDVYGHDVPRDFGAFSAAFATCLVTTITAQCMASVDPDCLQFSAVKDFSNSMTLRLSTFPWTKMQPLKTQLAPKTNFIIPFLAATFQFLDDKESARSGTVTTEDVVKWMNELLVRLHFSRDCLKWSHTQWDYGLAPSPPPVPPPPPPPPPPAPKCENYYADYERCTDLSMESTLTLCSRNDRVCKFIEYGPFYECTCPR